MKWLKQVKRTAGKVYYDPLANKFIFWAITLLGPYLVNKIPPFNFEVVALFTRWGVATNYHSYMAWAIGVAIIILIWCLIRWFSQHRYHLLYHRRHGKLLDIDWVKFWNPRMTRIAIVGEADTGKTTTIENLLEIRHKNTSTLENKIYVANISNSSYKYIGFLDGPGQSPAAQNDLAILSDIVVVMVDHNSSPVNTSLSQARLTDHKAYLRTLISRIKRDKISLKKVFLLANKHDLWRKLSEEELVAFRAFVSDCRADLKNGIPGINVEVINFRNDITDPRIDLKERLITNMK